MWNELSAAIAAKVATSVNIDAGNIFEYPKTNLDGYPAVTVTPKDGAGEFGDTARNRRTYIFSVKVYQEQLEQGRVDTERILRTIIDELITIFDADSYLNSHLAGRGFAKPMPSSWDYIFGENSATRVAEILIECVVMQ